MKLWQGRLDSATNALAEELNRSLPFDSKMAAEDIRGSIAHATMLGAAGIIDASEAARIVQGLETIAEELADGTLVLDPTAEDIHTAIEQLLTARIGDAGKRLHTARSRNDQVALDLRLYLMGQNDALRRALREAIDTLCAVAGEHVDTVMPGYTHLQIAQPVTFGHHLMAYAQMFARDLERLLDAQKRTAISPLGAGALASTGYPIDRDQTAQALGMRAPTENSMDSVSDRDFVLELAATLSILAMHLSRIAEELILFSSHEFGFVSMSDAFSTGSSIMPQKKNPDMAELLRGKAGRVYGNLVALLTMMKGLPLAYNKDIQEDKEPIFDSCETVLACLRVLAPMLASMTVHKERMRRAAAHGYINATDCADYLTEKGMPFRDAYRITGQIVARAVDAKAALEELPLETYREFSDLFEADLFEAISVENALARRRAFGGPAPERVREQIERLQDRLNEME